MNNYEATDRYGSTPSLNPPINNYNLKFGSTHDLRHNLNAIGSRKAYAYSNLINYDSMDSISPDSICSSQSTLYDIVVLRKYTYKLKRKHLFSE